jgi:hypothetical protein
MKKRGVSRKFLTVALALGLLANAGGKPAFAKAREVIGSARTTAITIAISRRINSVPSPNYRTNLRCTEPALPGMDSHLVSVDLLPHVRYWPLADICFAPTNACSGGKGDVIVDGPQCPLMTQSGHWPPHS